ncbi:MAG: hypothetical protein QNK37_01695 [Acidobacteriota bacterium]|nr:hypothetical protein [Acidobacteriota bacterium]
MAEMPVIQSLLNIIKELYEKIQQLNDEIAAQKGHKGRPKIPENILNKKEKEEKKTEEGQKNIHSRVYLVLERGRVVPADDRDLSQYRPLFQTLHNTYEFSGFDFHTGRVPSSFLIVRGTTETMPSLVFFH